MEPKNIHKEIDSIIATMPPRKQKTIDNLGDVTLIPAANGYIVRSKSTGAAVYVFPDIDKAFDFIRAHLAPTGDQADFLKAV